MEFLSGFWVYAVSFLAVLTAIIFVHEWGHYIVARWNGVRVDVFSIGFGRELFGWNDRNNTRWKVSIIPLGGYVKFFGDADATSSTGGDFAGLSPEERAVSFHHKSLGRRAAIVAAGPVTNFIFAILIFAALFAVIGQPFTPPVVGGVVAGSPAEAAGFRPDDRVLSVNGSRIERFEDLRTLVALNAETPLDIVVLRDGVETPLAVTPRRVEVPDGFGGTQRLGQVGLQTSTAMEFVRHDPVSALWYGARETWSVIGHTMTYLSRFVSGRESGEELGGPLRIAKMSGDVAQLSLIALVSLMATLSVSIGLINLFPIPMLDGGHLLFYAVEAIRGRPLGERAQEYGFRVGLLLVLSLFVFATWNDLVHLQVVSYVSGLFS